MADVWVFGTVAVDLILHVPHLPQPGDHLAGDLHGWRLGGSSANIACGLAAAGHTVHLVGPLGDDPTADALVHELHKRRVRTDHLSRLHAPSPRALILVDSHGERAIIGLTSAPAAPPPPAPPDDAELARAGLLFIESYAKYPNTLIDRAPSALIATPLPDPGAPCGPAHLVVGSRAELPPPWRDAPYAAARNHVGDQLHWLVTTDGTAGSTAYSAENTVHVDAEPAQQVDATGAGDAYTAGLLHTLLTGGGITEAMTCGAHWGAAAVETWQSVPPPPPDVLHRGTRAD
jgi:sulfofructose kinase